MDSAQIHAGMETSIEKRRLVCTECGGKLTQGESACPRCGFDLASPAWPRSVDRAGLQNPCDSEYARIKAEVESGVGIEADLDSYMQTVEGMAWDGDAMAQQFLGSMAFLRKDMNQAVGYFQDAAAQGNALAEADLARMYECGEGVAKDEYAAVRLYRRAAAKGEPRAMFAMANCYSKGRILAKDESKATALIRILADAGYPQAQYDLSQRYYSGIGVDDDLGQSLMWCRLAADAGLAVAEYTLAGFYHHGIGVKKDDRESIRWLERAVSHGDKSAMLDLAIEYAMREDELKNPGRAFYLVSTAVDCGFAPAMWLLSYCYRFGVGAMQDIERADGWLARAMDSGASEAWHVRDVKVAEVEFPCRMKWAGEDIERLRAVSSWFRRCGFDRGAREVLLKSVSLGDHWAENDLAQGYEKGLWGLNKDIGEAVRLYRLAADAGDLCALNNLANLYYAGIGVEQDLRKAEELALKAADGGDVDAMYNLAMRHWREDASRSIPWLERAAAKGDAQSLFFLGRALVLGDNMPRDVDRGLQLLTQAGRLGDATAWVVLGDIFRAGKIVPTDYNAALQYYEEAARYNDSEAFRLLSEMYGHGWGCRQDVAMANKLLLKSVEMGNGMAYCRLGELKQGRGEFKEAAEWFRKAWDAGISYGKYGLAVMYWKGEGFPQDETRAIALAKEAMAAGAEDVLGIVRARDDANPEQAADGASAGGYWFAKVLIGVVLFYFAVGALSTIIGGH